MLRPAQFLARRRGKHIGYRPRRERHFAQVRAPRRRFVVLRHAEQPAISLDHHAPRLVDRRRDQRDPRVGIVAGEGAHPFRPGASLAEAAPGADQPHAPIAFGLSLSLHRPAAPVAVDPLEHAQRPRAQYLRPFQFGQPRERADPCRPSHDARTICSILMQFSSLIGGVSRTLRSASRAFCSIRSASAVPSARDISTARSTSSPSSIAVVHAARNTGSRRRRLYAASLLIPASRHARVTLQLAASSSRNAARFARVQLSRRTLRFCSPTCGLPPLIAGTLLPPPIARSLRTNKKGRRRRRPGPTRNSSSFLICT